MADFMKTTSVGGDDLDTNLWKFMCIIYEQLQQHPGSNITMINLQAVGIKAGLKSIPTQNDIINSYHWNCMPTMSDAVNLHKLVNETKNLARKAKIKNLQDDQHQAEVSRLQQRINVLEGTIKAMENRGIKRASIVDIRESDAFKQELIKSKMEIEEGYKHREEEVRNEVKAQYEAYIDLLLGECSSFARKITNLVEKHN